AFILPAQNRTDCAPSFWRIRQRPRRLTHCVDRRRMGIKRLYRVKIFNEIEKELGLVGQIAEGKDTTIHEPLDEPLAKTSHQFGMNKSAFRHVLSPVPSSPATR